MFNKASTSAGTIGAFEVPDIDNPVNTVLKAVLEPMRAMSVWMFESPVAQAQCWCWWAGR